MGGRCFDRRTNIFLTFIDIYYLLVSDYETARHKLRSCSIVLVKNHTVKYVLLSIANLNANLYH